MEEAKSAEEIRKSAEEKEQPAGEQRTADRPQTGAAAGRSVKKYGRIGAKVVLGLIIFAVVLIVSISISVGRLMQSELESYYATFAYSYARSVADLIDGDRVAGYLETGEIDDHYLEVNKVMDVLCMESGLTYLYAFVPYEDYFVYVWDAESGDGQPNVLGDRDVYMEGYEEVIGRVYCKDPVEKLAYYPEDSVAMALVPVFDSTGEPVAIVGADFDTRGARYIFLYYMGVILINIILLFTVFIVIYYYIIKKMIIVPIRKLTKATTELKDNLDSEGEAFHVDINTNDEIEELGDNFERMDGELRSYITTVKSITAAREHLDAELSLAATIQERMLPQTFPAFPERGEFDLYASMTPAREVGGDFYDYFLIDDDHLGLVIADVSDKGVPAALFMAVCKTLIKNHMMLGGTPDEVLNHVNDELCENEANEMFVTVWLGTLTLSTGETVFANGGHESPVIGHPEEGFGLVDTGHGPPLGIYEGVSYQLQSLKLDPGDILFLYTDGLPEATNVYQDMLGLDGMIDALNAHRGATVTELLTRVKLAADHFAEGREPFDDLTMLALRYDGPVSPEKT